MEINTSKMKEETKKFGILINDFEDNITNLYNKFDQSSQFWNDGKSKTYFDNLQIRKKEINKVIGDLYYIKQIYDKIISLYDNIGKKIKCNLEKKETVNLYYNNLIASLDNLMAKYNNLNSSFNQTIHNKISSQRKNIATIKTNIKTLKEKTIDLFETINENEKRILNMISKFDTTIIKEKIIELNKMSKNVGIVYEDSDELEKIIKTSNMYIREITQNIFTLKDIFENIKHVYISQTSESLNEKLKEEIINIENIAINSVSDESILNKVIEKYEEIFAENKANHVSIASVDIQKRSE